MAGALDPNFTVIDVTAPEQASVEREFSSEELVIFGMPVYMGRIPAAAAPRLQGLKGNHTPCILAATYGNRHYDDALAEMAGIAERNGFLIQGAAALVGRHTYGEIQVGRPDEADLEADRAFARKAAENKKMQSEIPGKYPEGEEYESLEEGANDYVTQLPYGGVLQEDDQQNNNYTEPGSACYSKLEFKHWEKLLQPSAVNKAEKLFLCSVLF